MLRFKIFNTFQSLALFVSGMGLLVWQLHMATEMPAMLTLGIAFMAVAAAGSLLEAEGRFWPFAFLVATLGLARLVYVLFVCAGCLSLMSSGFAILLGLGFTLTAVLILAGHTHSYHPEPTTADHKH